MLTIGSIVDTVVHASEMCIYIYIYIYVHGVQLKSEPYFNTSN
jgi:hypothetical protein